MLTTRLSATTNIDGLARLGPSIQDAVHQHPLYPHLDALVLIGVGNPMLVQPDDPSCRVMVPLIGSRHVDALSRAQMASVHALVLLDRLEWRGGKPKPEDPLVVIATPSAGRPSHLMRGCVGIDGLEAAERLHLMPVLRGAVEEARSGATSTPICAAEIADSVMEAVLATGRTG